MSNPAQRCPWLNMESHIVHHFNKRKAKQFATKCSASSNVNVVTWASAGWKQLSTWLAQSYRCHFQGQRDKMHFEGRWIRNTCGAMVKEFFWEDTWDGFGSSWWFRVNTLSILHASFSISGTCDTRAYVILDVNAIWIFRQYHHWQLLLTFDNYWLLSSILIV